MHVDVTELIEFYRAPMGRTARRIITARLKQRWTAGRGMAVLGLGFATPYLAALCGPEVRGVALMPAAQGVYAWPAEGPYRAALVADHQFPLPDASVDRIVAVHSLEMTERPGELLHEVWRVLNGEGRLTLVVPRRAGLWANLDTMPFGHGRPYSRGQLDRLLKDAMLRPEHWSGALAMPPVSWALGRKSAPAWERIGRRLWPPFCGVTIVEASKHVGAPLRAQTVPIVRDSLVLRPTRVPAQPTFTGARRLGPHGN